MPDDLGRRVRTSTGQPPESHAPVHFRTIASVVDCEAGGDQLTSEVYSPTSYCESDLRGDPTTVFVPTDLTEGHPVAGSSDQVSSEVSGSPRRFLLF